MFRRARVERKNENGVGTLLFLVSREVRRVTICEAFQQHNRVRDRSCAGKRSRITKTDIETNRESCFSLHGDEEESRVWYGLSNMLNMPRDSLYITNNGLTLHCYFSHIVQHADLEPVS